MKRPAIWSRLWPWSKGRDRELRTTVRDPAEWLHDALAGGPPSAAGIHVGPNKALTLSAYFAAIRAISEDIAKLPLVTYERLQPRGKKRAPAYPLYSLLHDAPNPETSSMAFRETMTQHAIGWGNGYAEIERAGNMPKALWILDPNRVEPKRDADTNELYYLVRSSSGKPDAIPMDDMFHLHGLGFDGVTGYSVAKLARESLGSAMAMEQSAGAFFGNNSRPGGVLETPQKLGNEGRRNLRESWEAAYGGAAKAGKTAVLEQDVKFHTISIPNKDAQWIESRQFSIEEFCRWIRIPPHKIHQLLNATYTNITHQDLEYHGDALMPWEVRWEQEIARKLIPRSDRATYFAEHLTAAVLRADMEMRYRIYAIARQNGLMSANDVMELENRNPLKGDQGDVYWMPANMMDASKVNDPPPKPEPPTPAPAVEPTDDADGDTDRAAPARVREALLPLLADVYRRLLTVETNKAASAAATNKLDEWRVAWLPEHEVQMQTGPGLCVSMDVFGHLLGLDEIVVRRLTAGMATRHLERLKGALRADGTFGALSPEAIARSETEILFKELNNARNN